MPTITVSHALGSYPVLIATGSLRVLPSLVGEYLPGRRTAMITDDVVDRLYGDFLGGTNRAWRPPLRTGAEEPPPGWRTRLTFPAGEASKTREWWERLSDELLVAGYGRDCGVVALGGGVVGDLAGFVAATYLRGVPYVQVPTTLLAMLDASVGGKVGVDTPAGKNLIGAFHPPSVVVADPATLLTLPDRTFRAGLAEAVKHGVIADAAYFEWLWASASRLEERDLTTVEDLVRRSVEIKAAVVSGDEREAGRRAILNAGHTVAHAIEQASAYTIAHGEAVALGLVAESAVGELLGLTAAGTAERVRALLNRVGLPIRLSHPLPKGELHAAMGVDKKNRQREIRLALPAAVGSVPDRGGTWTVPVDAALLNEGLASITP